MNINKAIRLILLVVVLVGGSFYHIYNLPESKSYELTVIDKWESESCGKRSCTAEYVMQYKVNETGYVSKMSVLQRDYLNFNKGGVARYTLSRKESHDVPTSSYILEGVSIFVLIAFALFLFFLSILYIVLIFGCIIEWKFDIDDFKFWNWKS